MPDTSPGSVVAGPPARARSPETVTCQRCRKVLVEQDEIGWYYQQPVTDPAAPGLTFMDRVHECDGKPHAVRLRDELAVLAARWDNHAAFLDGRADLAPEGRAVLMFARAQAHQDCASELRALLAKDSTRGKGDG